MSETRAYYKVGDKFVAVPPANVAAAESKWSQQNLQYTPVHRGAAGNWLDGPDPRIAQEAESDAQRLQRMQDAMGEIGPGEAASQRFGQGALAGAGVKLRAGSDAFQNWINSKSPGMVDPLTGDPAETQGRGIHAPLKGYEDFERTNKARLAQGDAQQPLASAAGGAAGTMALSAAIPGARVAPGAGVLKNAAAGLSNVGIDAATAGVQAANEAPEGYAWEDAKRAALPAGAVSALFRAPRGATVAARGARDLAVSTLAPEVAPAARTLTDLTPEGRQMRQAARAGAENLDPQIRRTAAAIDRAEVASDQVRHELRGSDFKRKDLEDAFRAEMQPTVPQGAPELRAPGVPKDTEYTLPNGEDVTVKGVASGGESVPAGPAARRKRVQVTEAGVVDAPEAAPPTKAVPPPAGFDPVVAVANGMGTAEQLQHELSALLTHADDMAPGIERQAVRELHRRAGALVEKLSPHLKNSGSPEQAARAAADAFIELDNFKRTLGSYAARVRSGFTQQALRGMYMDTLRPHLEDASVWGARAAGEQKAINERWTPWLNERERFERTVLTPDAVTPGADTFERVRQGDRSKIAGVLSNAGTAAGDLDEASMREGLRTSVDLTDQAARMTGASPRLKENAAAVRRDADLALQELDASRANRTAMREARDVAQAAPYTSKAVNALGAAEAAVRNSPVLSAVARGGEKAAPAAGAAYRVGGRAASRVAGQSQESAAEADAMADPKYGAMIAAKPQAERAFVIGTLNASDPEFRARQRAAAEKRRSDNNGQ